MIVIGGFGFILIWCLTPFIIEGAKTILSLIYVFVVITLTVTYGIPLVLAAIPFVLGIFLFLLVVLILFGIWDNHEQNKYMNSPERLARIEKMKKKKAEANK